MEIQRAAKLAGTKMPDADFVREMALDMASSPALARVANSRVAELFAIARAHYEETPLLRHLVKAWDNHMKPKAEAPTPADRPRLEPPQIDHSEAQMRHLAAVRTSMAAGGQMRVMATVRKREDHSVTLCSELEIEGWMVPLLEQDPSRMEVKAMARACTPSSLAFYRRRPDIYPHWGRWLEHYGI